MSIWENYFPTWKQKNYSEHKGTKVEDFNLEQKNRFNRNKDNVTDNMIVQGEETIPEKDMQLLKEFLQTILNPAKLPDTPTGIWNHGPERLERLLERHADASKEESLIDADGARNSFIHFKHFINTGSNKDKTPTEICEILAKPGVYEDIFISCSHMLGNKTFTHIMFHHGKHTQFSDLLPLSTASLTRKNPQRCKIIHGMYPIGRKDRSTMDWSEHKFL